MNLQELMGFIFTITLIFPIIIIISLRLYRFKSFLALGIYYLLGFCDDLMLQGYIQVSADFRRIYAVTNTLLDIPLLLTFLSYFSPASIISKRMKSLILVFIAFEILVTTIVGFDRNGLTIIIAPELAIILFFCGWFFIRHIKIAIAHGKAIGKAVMTASLLFAFGCYTLMYIMYYILKTQNTTDVFIIYLISSSLSVIAMSAGLLIENKRIKKLEELKITRKELKDIYSTSNMKKKLSGKSAPQ